MLQLEAGIRAAVLLPCNNVEAFKLLWSQPQSNPSKPSSQLISIWAGSSLAFAAIVIGAGLHSPKGAPLTFPVVLLGTKLAHPGCPWVPGAVRWIDAVPGSSVCVLAAAFSLNSPG